MDPPGLLFEGFDSIGVHRTTVKGLPVQTQSEIDGKPYADGRALGPQLASDPRVAQCMVKQLYRHANGRLDVSPLAACRSLKHLVLPAAAGNLETLRPLAQLETLGDQVGGSRGDQANKKAADFWREYDAKKGAGKK